MQLSPGILRGAMIVKVIDLISIEIPPIALWDPLHYAMHCPVIECTCGFDINKIHYYKIQLSDVDEQVR